MLLYYFLIFLIPFPEYRRFSDFVGDITLIKVVGVCTVCYAILKHLQGVRIGFWPKGSQVFWFICYFLGLFTIHFSMKVLSDWSVHIALFYVMMVLVDSLETIIKSFVITVLAMLVNCYQSWKGLYLYGYYLRPTGSFGDPNYFALGLIVSIAMAVCLYKLYPKFRVLSIGAVLMLFFTLLLTSSRGGILGLAVMFILFLRGLGQFRKIIIYLTLVTAIFVTITIYFSPDTLSRIQGDNYSTKSSTENRIELIIAGLNMIKANMLTGVGYQMFKESAKEYNPEITGRGFIAHNSYLSVAAELGLPIFSLFFALLIATYRQINKMTKIAKVDERLFTVVNTIKIAFVGYCCSIAFLTAEREKYLWLLIFFIMALSKILYINNLQEDQSVAV